MKTYSQYRQDKLIDFLFRGKKNGTFLDIGAHDGISYSNTYSLEKERDWSGLCIEPMPDIYAKLIKNRTCIAENCCISDTEQTVTFRRVTGKREIEMLSGILDFFDAQHIIRIEQAIKQLGGSYQDIPIECKNINNILNTHNLSHIDFCSIDTEGAEFKIIKSIDFENITITAFSIENNYQDNSVREFMKSKGYDLFESEVDDIFVLKGTPGKFLFSKYVWIYKLTWKIWRRLPKWMQFNQLKRFKN